MRITILALGSTGDVAPCAALGGGLVRAGHQVRLATFENFASMARHNGLAFTCVEGDAQALVSAGSSSFARLLFGFINLARQYCSGFSAPELLETDLVLNQLPGGLFGWDLAEKAGVPHVALAYLPLLPTRAYPMMAFPRLFSALPGYNRLTYRLAAQVVWMYFQGPVNRWRASVLGLPPQKPGGRLEELGTAACPWLIGASPQLMSPQPDWPPEVTFTGYWYPSDDGWQPPVGLQRFIEEGAAPVFIGFGSMPVRDPAQATRTVLSALEQTGLRAVLHAGWAGLGGSNLPRNVFCIDYAPYGWLFPCMRGLVIHGGAGSVHFAARSGIPALVVPFAFDQFTWGLRFAELGNGPLPLPFKRLTAGRLARSLSSLVSDAKMRSRAEQLGAAVRREEGIPAAVRWVGAQVR